MRRLRNVSCSSSLLNFIIITHGCGAGGGGNTIVAQAPQTTSNSHSLPAEDVEGEEDSPVEAYEIGDEGQGNAVAADIAQVWVNFNGATVSAEESLVVQQTTNDDVTIPRFEMTDLAASSYAHMGREQVINEVMALLRSRYQDVLVEFSTDRSVFGNTEYSTLHVGGANFTGIGNLLGISPLDVDNFSHEDVLFVFSSELQDYQDGFAMLLNGMSHELNHSFGARHINSEYANLNPEVSSATWKFDVDGPRVDDASAVENTQRILINNLGARQEEVSDNLGLVSNLNIHKNRDVGQISPHFASQRISLRRLRFEWQEGGRTWRGRVLRLKFDRPGLRELYLRVFYKNEKDPIETYKYMIGKAS